MICYSFQLKSLKKYSSLGPSTVQIDAYAGIVFIDKQFCNNIAYEASDDE